MRFRRSLHNHEDWEFYVRWAAKGNWSEYLDQELCIYLKYPESLCTDKENMALGYHEALDYIGKVSSECQHYANIRMENDKLALTSTDSG